VIHYKKGYKYQLANQYEISTDIKPFRTIETKFIVLLSYGQLVILEGYAWDGPSGLTLDTKNSLRASLVHDALYQLIREEEIHVDCRSQIDKLFYDICREDGMSWWRAKYWYRAVRKFGGAHCKPGKIKPSHTAP